MMRSVYPFSAVVGQDDLKLALLLSAVDPAIGGVLIKGERGTAKTTIARGLAALLPPKAEGTPVPFVELPLGATEDRVVGSLDVSKALRDGHTQLRSGVLARADGGVLYVDEVNLLPDHLVDLLLDAAASGWVTVERDGVSAGEAARFVLVGTMNPEEGDLRPQFLDRFGLSVQVRGLDTRELRMAAIGKRLEFDADPAAVIDAARGAEDALRQAIADARARLSSLPVTAAILAMVTAICSEQQLDGIRGDLAIVKTARALAAWEEAQEIGPEHIRKAAALALPHRMRKRPAPPSRSVLRQPSAAEGASRLGSTTQPFGAASQPGSPTQPFDTASQPGAPTQPFDAASQSGPTTRVFGVAGAPRSDSSTQSTGAAPHADRGGAAESAAHARRIAPVHAIDLQTDLIDLESSGRRGSGSTASRRAVRATPYDQTGTLAINETLTVAATRGGRVGERGVSVAPADLMQHKRSGPGRSHVLFLVDASASMATQRRLELAKGAALELLNSNYQHRDEVALMTFHGDRADLLVPFTPDVSGVEQALVDVPTGGRTPLARGLIEATEVLQSRAPALLVLFTDGRANVSAANGDPWKEALDACDGLRAACAGALVIDCERGPIVLGRARQLAAKLGAECIALSALRETELIVKISRQIEAFQ